MAFVAGKFKFTVWDVDYGWDGYNGSNGAT